MGTRAQFFIGNPQDLENRIWLGCVAFDGYPDGDLKPLSSCKTEGEFRETLSRIIATRDDFCDPAHEDFPFPWENDLFLTDCTYAFIDGEVLFNFFHAKPMPMAEYLARPDDAEDLPDILPRNVPAPRSAGKPKGADSIMIVSSAR